MSSRSLLMVLLVLTCLRAFTTANNIHQPSHCCFSYQNTPIPAHAIEVYERTERLCSQPGVIFTLNSGRKVCADPDTKWVQKSMKVVDGRHSHA